MNPDNYTHIPVCVDDVCIHCKKLKLSHRVYHNPTGDPCTYCDLPATHHRVKHEPYGIPCPCGVPLEGHRQRTRSVYEQFRRHKHLDRKTLYLGIDGEGQGRDIHKYVLLAASDETGNHSYYVENTDGLPTTDCFDFMLGLGSNSTRIFAFAFNYDLTKILSDLDDESIYTLFRPHLRQRRGKEKVKGPRHISWNGYQINWQAAKFSVRWRKERVVIWDLFKFYQSKFTVALKDWKIGDPARIKYIEEMKDKRSEFDKLSMEEIRPYCLEECRYMAIKARKLTDAHIQAKLKLKTYYGAGSSASAMLEVMSIRSKIQPTPLQLKKPIASSFFGGRFENSVVGPVEKPIYDWDIASAYPYQLCFLPCLLHGKWFHVKKREHLSKGRTALVRYRLHPKKSECNDSWAPFPFRLEDGSITFPGDSHGGWLWAEEFLAGERIFKGVEFVEAWVYDYDCACQPFDQIPSYYLERLRIGKEGPGIVIKLGMNSNYGKLVQSIGSAPFQCWMWGSLITSRTRAQILDLAGLHKDLSNLLSIATDGIKTLEVLTPPEPKDTGTFREVKCNDGSIQYKPLGYWEPGKVDPITKQPIPSSTKGVFFSRPGIHFPMNPTEDEVKKVRARGLGRGILYENWQKIVDGWYQGLEYVQVANVTRFMGAKTSIHYSEKDGYKRSPLYGQWTSRIIDMSFNPLPKRDEALADGRLTLRYFPKQMSQPYKRSVLSADAIMLKAVAQEVIEQPDGADWSDYEGHE
jgi:hypothetical protein